MDENGQKKYFFISTHIHIIDRPHRWDLILTDGIQNYELVHGVKIDELLHEYDGI